MRRGILVTVVLLAVFVARAPAEEPKGKVLAEVWEAAFLEGSQVGHVHELFREITMGEMKLIEASTELELNLVRFGEKLQLTFTMADHETPDGKVFALVVQQPLSKDQKLIRKGKVEGKHLHIKAEMNGAVLSDKKMPWNDKALGLYGEKRLFQDRKLEPGAKFDFLKFEPELDSMITYHVEMKEWEEATLLKGVKQRLFRVETRMDKVQGIELRVTGWIDEKGDTFKRQVEIPGIGQIVFYRTTRELALARGGKAPVDIGISQLVRLNQAILRPLDAKEITYRIRLKGVDEPLKAFASDDRQKVQNGKEDAFEIVIQGRQQPGDAKPGQEPPKDFLKSNHFIRAEDNKVKDLAEQAVGDESDPWKKALRIEQWVHKNLKNKNYSEAFATADQVARTLEGDCTEHAILAAAMCRAAGVPARPAVGLVYVAADRSMCYHMWLEVWVNGQWLGLDPTLGLGRIGVGHLKITDHHWNDVQSFTPLFPVTRILGKVQIEVLAVKYEK